MFGNLLRECGVTERLTRSAQNELINLITIVLGLCVGVTMDGDSFLRVGDDQDPRARLRRVRALDRRRRAARQADGPAARQPGQPADRRRRASRRCRWRRASRTTSAQEADPDNYLLMHAMGPNVAGVIGTAIAAGAFLALLE